jgi:hypothetical protein
MKKFKRLWVLMLAVSIFAGLSLSAIAQEFEPKKPPTVPQKGPTKPGPPTGPAVKGPPAKGPSVTGPPKGPSVTGPPKGPAVTGPPKGPAVNGPPAKGPVVKGPVVPHPPGVARRFHPRHFDRHAWGLGRAYPYGCRWGRCGYWWWVGGYWYFYDQPFGGAPVEVSLYAYDEQGNLVPVEDDEPPPDPPPPVAPYPPTPGR